MAVDPRMMPNRQGLLQRMLQEAGLGAGPLPPPNIMQGRNPMQAPDPRRIYQTAVSKAAVNQAPVQMPRPPQPPRQMQAPAPQQPIPESNRKTIQQNIAAMISSENPGIFNMALKAALTTNAQPYKRTIEKESAKIMPAIKILREHNERQRRMMKKAKPKQGSIQA